ncbi:MAG: hypothetical protein ABS949_17090 [Solibacillus sp.]
MLNALNLKLILEFHIGNDSNGDAITSKVTISNLRLDLTGAEILEIAQLFESLVDYPLTDALAVTTSSVNLPQ